ncbi:hypothetical protein N9995_00410 [bacterium]|nr:hypothetical protein [bacterium]
MELICRQLPRLFNPRDHLKTVGRQRAEPLLLLLRQWTRRLRRLCSRRRARAS